MTSDKAVSDARTLLNYALGKERVGIGGLTPKEFDELFVDVFNEVCLRELRGFKDLKDLISRRSETNEGALKHISVDIAAAEIVNKASSELACDLSSHMLWMSRGLLSREITYHRHESDEKTTDWEVANKWKNVYAASGCESMLALRRPYDSDYSREGHLFEVGYKYHKVPHQDEMRIYHIEVEYVPLSKFRKHFGEKYPRIACDLISELRFHVSSTVDALQSHAQAFQRTLTDLERLSGAISSS